MKNHNTVSLIGSCDWPCGCGWNSTCGNGCLNPCGNGCTNDCGCANGCGCMNCGCANGCGNGCANGCGNNCGCVNGCGNGCANGCGNNSGCTNCGCTGNCGCNANCGSNWCWANIPPLASGGMLVPRIIASGRATQRATNVTLCVQDIPECAQPPYALAGVSASGPSDWEFIASDRYCATLRVTIPLTAQIRDCAGCVYTGHSSVTVDVPVRITIPQADLGRANVTVMPSVRLICTSGCSDDGCFTVSLAVLVDVYVTQWELSSDGITVPCRPDLPLTLPPHFNRCCR